MAVIVTTSVCIFALKNKEDVVYATEETSVRFNPETLQDNEHMHVEIDESGEKVPVPNGYAGSKATGEKEIDSGYVIYEGEDEVNDSNVEEAQKTRNQYVWVPVADASKMYGTDEKGKKRGKNYSFTNKVGNNIDEETGTLPNNWKEENGIMYILNNTITQEPSVGENDKEEMLRKSRHEFLNQLEKEFNSMINSVEKYGGFYIGRYETGDLSQGILKVVKGNTDISNQNWYTMYKKVKKMKKSNINIETNLLWGCQWDRTLMWLIESGNRTKQEISVDALSWGNYSKSIGNAEVGSGSIRPTGYSESWNTANIYDLAGNVDEWTNEFYNNWRISRGDGYNPYNSNKVCSRNSFYPQNKYGFMRLSCNIIY